MRPFVYDQLPQRVVFGAGRRAAVPDEVDRLGRRVLLISDGAAEATAAQIAEALAARLARRWNDVVQHVPIDLADRARAAATEADADVVVSVGGGSSTGLAKAIALTHRIPIVAVPTTYAGSEQTAIYGLTSDRHKQTGKDPAVLPRAVVYDPELTLELPADVTGPSSMNALAHAVEALYVPGHNPVTTTLALEAVRVIHDALPVVMARLDDVDARGDLLYGAYLAGMALGATTAGMHHKLAHVLGGTFGLVHADTHAALLPHVVAFNASALPERMARLAGALGAPDGDAAGALWDLAVASDIPTSLAALGLGRGNLAEAADRAAAEIGENPRPFTTAGLLALLERAFDGRRPTDGAIAPT
jgi:maleylacetate reductase